MRVVRIWSGCDYSEFAKYEDRDRLMVFNRVRNLRLVLHIIGCIGCEMLFLIGTVV